MIFEFLITYNAGSYAEIRSIIRGCLLKALEDNLDEFDTEAIDRMIIPRAERTINTTVDEDGKALRQAIFCFSLDLPDEVTSPRVVIDEFSDSLVSAPTEHVVKFEDPLLRADLSRWTDEVYALEMKLRRVLTLVYLRAYWNKDPYDLLFEERAQPISKERPKAEEMKERAENQFFHLTFSQYVGLNQRPEFKLQDVLNLVRNKNEYEKFREELTRSPVEDEEDAVLLAGLKERMDAIEAMRNCCAHNRRPSKKVEENYRNARPLLDQLLDGYLSRWEFQEPVEEMYWERRAREAVEDALKLANWNEEERTITLHNADDDRNRETVTSREELDRYLCNLARSEFYADVPRSDGEYVAHPDENDIVLGALELYEDRLGGFFDGGDRDPTPP